VWFIANRKSTGARKNECGIRGLFDGHIDGEQNIADTNNRGQAKQEEQATGDKQHCRRDSDRDSTDNESWNENWLEVAGEFCRVDDGVPVKLDGFELSKAGHRVERLKALGNAIVPQVAMEIFKAIKFAEENIKKE
jgi:DNA (cytosine-5)-methyltransferase 1